MKWIQNCFLIIFFMDKVILLPVPSPNVEYFDI